MPCVCSEAKVLKHNIALHGCGWAGPVAVQLCSGGSFSCFSDTEKTAQYLLPTPTTRSFFIRCQNITATPLLALQLCLWHRLEFPPCTTMVMAGTPCLWPISVPPHLLQVISQWVVVSCCDSQTFLWLHAIVMASQGHSLVPLCMRAMLRLHPLTSSLALQQHLPPTSDAHQLSSQA